MARPLEATSVDRKVSSPFGDLNVALRVYESMKDKSVAWHKRILVFPFLKPEVEAHCSYVQKKYLYDRLPFHTKK